MVNGRLLYPLMVAIVHGVWERARLKIGWGQGRRFFERRGVGGIRQEMKPPFLIKIVPSSPRAKATLIWTATMDSGGFSSCEHRFLSKMAKVWLFLGNATPQAKAIVGFWVQNAGQSRD